MLAALRFSFKHCTEMLKRRFIKLEGYDESLPTKFFRFDSSEGALRAHSITAECVIYMCVCGNHFPSKFLNFLSANLAQIYLHTTTDNIAWNVRRNVNVPQVNHCKYLQTAVILLFQTLDASSLSLLPKCQSLREQNIR